MSLEYQGIKIIPNKIIERNQIIRNTENGLIFINPYLCAKIILKQDKDYLDVFTHVGINKDSIEACVDYAKYKIKKNLKINELLKNNINNKTNENK